MFKVPQLRVFDFKRITTKERDEARKLFGGKAGKKLLDEMKNTFTPGEELERNIKARLIFYFREKIYINIISIGKVPECLKKKRRG